MAKGGWVFGVIGAPSNLFPNSQEVKSARTCFYIYVILNFTIDTRDAEFMVEEVVIAQEEGECQAPCTPELDSELN